jgi:hypothetical protein
MLVSRDCCWDDDDEQVSEESLALIRTVRKESIGDGMVIYKLYASFDLMTRLCFERVLLLGHLQHHLFILVFVNHLKSAGARLAYFI